MPFGAWYALMPGQFAVSERRVAVRVFVGLVEKGPSMCQYLRITDDYRRTIVCGDIHGCFDELRELLQLVEFTDQDILVHVGDMIDRGPASWEVAEFFRDTPNAVSALGNHERRLARSVQGTSHPAWSQLQTLSRLPMESWGEWADAFLLLPAVIETDHAIVTHSRLDPSLPLDDQDPHFTCAVGGPSVVIELDQTGVPLWYYDTDFDKPIGMGHIGYERIELVPGGLYALDTGAVKGKTLTAMVFPGDEIVSIEAPRDYYSEAREQWATRDASSDLAFSEWALARTLPRGDPADWPLKTVMPILELPQPVESEALLDAIARIETSITELQLVELIAELKRRLLDRDGEIPPPGPGRGEFYHALKSTRLKGQIGTLATKILSGQCDAFADMPMIFKKKGTMRTVLDRLNALMAVLEGA